MKKVNKKPSLRRPMNPMPESIKTLLIKHDVLELYKKRPAYQQNDYLGWIARAKLDETQIKRTNQMLDELKKGDVYMKMRWSSR
jgi:uncharacterized protein YdeI (YjbR/CyaY-like superfamily)